MSSRGAADGSSAISFEVQDHGDGTVRIKAGYYNLWVQLTAYDVKNAQWEPNSPYQRLTQRDAGNGYYSFTVDFLFSWSRRLLHFLKYIEVPCDGLFLDGMGWGGVGCISVSSVTAAYGSALTAGHFWKSREPDQPKVTKSALPHHSAPRLGSACPRSAIAVNGAPRSTSTARRPNGRPGSPGRTPVRSEGAKLAREAACQPTWSSQMNPIPVWELAREGGSAFHT